MEEREKVHNEGKGAKYTRARLPVKVVYVEEFETKPKAMSRKKRSKSLTPSLMKKIHQLCQRSAAVMLLGAILVFAGCQQQEPPRGTPCDGEPVIVTLFQYPIYGDVISFDAEDVYGGVLDVVLSTEVPTPSQLRTLERDVGGFKCGGTSSPNDIYLCLNSCATTPEELQEAINRAATSELVERVEPVPEMRPLPVS